VGFLEEMEIMCAVPEEVRCESFGVGVSRVDSVVSSRPRDLAVLRHSTCSGVREGELMWRWVPWDDLMRYGVCVNTILRIEE
jgi:hypothetical protein